MSWGGGFAPYVSVNDRKYQAIRKIETLEKQGVICNPIIIEKRVIAKTFWGKAWPRSVSSSKKKKNVKVAKRCCWPVNNKDRPGKFV